MLLAAAVLGGIHVCLELPEAQSIPTPKQAASNLSNISLQNFQPGPVGLPRIKNTGPEFLEDFIC